jgi:hypothetical protein
MHFGAIFIASGLSQGGKVPEKDLNGSPGEAVNAGGRAIPGLQESPNANLNASGRLPAGLILAAWPFRFRVAMLAARNPEIYVI